MVEYERAWQLQERLAGEIGRGARPPTLLLLEHPHTYTFGRRGQAENLLWDTAEREGRGVQVHWVDRGGDVTYHGPGQLVGYPLLPLAPGGLQVHSRDGKAHLPQADYVGYLRRLEQVLIRALGAFGVAAVQIPGLTGVWIHPRHSSEGLYPGENIPGKPAKIAAIGVKVDVRGVSRHGFALNVAPDMDYWNGIVGCGLQDYPVTSLAEQIDPPPDMESVSTAVVAAFGAVMGFQMQAGPDPTGRLPAEILPGKDDREKTS